MQHIQPRKDCTESCCKGPPECITAPTVTCFHGTTFDYTVQGAEIAYIERYSATWVLEGTTQVTLDENGDASGSHPTAPGYNYCIVATNDCGMARCCGYCRDILCFYTVVFPGPGNTLADTQVMIIGTARYGPLTMEMDGETETVTSGEATIEKIYNLGDMPEQICVTATNDCGNTCESCFDVPCCWRVNDLVIEVKNLSFYDHLCELDTITASGCYEYPGSKQYSRISVTGLGGIAGTQLFPLRGSTPLSVTPLTSVPDRQFGETNYDYDGWCACWDTGFLLNTGVPGEITVETERKTGTAPFCPLPVPYPQCTDGRILDNFVYWYRYTVYEGYYEWTCQEPGFGREYGALSLGLRVTSSSDHLEFVLNTGLTESCIPVVSDVNDDRVGCLVRVGDSMGVLYDTCDPSLPACDPNCFEYFNVYTSGSNCLGAPGGSGSEVDFTLWYGNGSTAGVTCQGVEAPFFGQTSPFYSNGSFEARYYFS